MPTAVGRRPSVCYLVAGHNLLSTAGPSRNVLSLARALSRFADVTVAFRRVLEPVRGEPFSVLEIQPDAPETASPVDDAAMRGIGWREFTGYLGALDRFADRHLGGFDVVLEKSWLLTGYVSSRCRPRGVAGIPTINVVPVVRHQLGAPAKAAKSWVARGVSGRYLRRAPRLIAESEDLKASIVRCWRVPAERIEVVGLGVDRTLFRPMDQETARCRIGVAPDRTVLLYVGALDRAHDLTPLIAALARLRDTAVELHLVGDGEYRAEAERAAAGSPRVVFHGRVPHENVPSYIACADLCLAAYDPAFFPRGQVGYSTLKLREYLAAGRPVAATRNGGLPDLIRPAFTGFLLDNDPDAWSRFLERELPSRAVLRRMGRAAAETALETWEETARSYWRVCERVLERRQRSPDRR